MGRTRTAPQSRKQPLAAGEAPRRAAIYLRVSTTEQAESFGLDAQRRRCDALLVLKEWQAAGEYVDAGLSGTLPADRRPALARLLADVEAGHIDAVVFAALDRLGRSTRLVLDLIAQFDAAGVAVASCKESLDSTTPTGRYLVTTFAALGELERDTIRERTAGGRDERARIDGEKGGHLPYGYRRAAPVVVDIDAARVVQRVFAHRRAGMTLSAIAGELNTAGIPSPQGAKWYASSIRELLLNEAAYLGGPRGDSPYHWPRILDNEGTADNDTA